LITELGILFESFADDFVELGREIGIEAQWRHGRAIEDGFEDYGGRVAAEWDHASGHLVENRAEREKIAAGVHFLAAGLLGRHVGDGAESGAGTGELFGSDAGGGHRGGGSGGIAEWAARCGGREFCEAEIENFGVAALGDKDIRGLDVAMDDAVGMGGVERVGDFDTDAEEHFEIERTAGDVMLQRFAVEKFHDDVGVGVFFAEIVDGADVWMIESGGGLGFALEALERLMIVGQGFGEEFQGHEAMELGVFCFVNDAHAAATEFFGDAIVGDGAADHWLRVCHANAILGCVWRQVNGGARGWAFVGRGGLGLVRGHSLKAGVLTNRRVRQTGGGVLGACVRVIGEGRTG
jgi:hypothetical protein